MHKGLKQGNALSSLLFNLVLKIALETAEISNKDQIANKERRQIPFNLIQNMQHI